MSAQCSLPPGSHRTPQPAAPEFRAWGLGFHQTPPRWQGERRVGHSHERTQRPCPPAVHGGLAPPTAGGAHHPRSTCTYATSAGVKMPLSPAISRPRAATSRPASLLMIAAVLPRSTCQAGGRGFRA